MSTLSWDRARMPFGGWPAARRDGRAAVTDFADSGPAPGFTDLQARDDAGLIDACLAKEPGAFDVLVERHRRAVYQLCYRFVANHEDASDLSQEVFLRAFRSLGGFRRQSSVGTWLYRIGVNVCLSRAASRRRPSEPLEARDHADPHAESPAERVLRHERQQRVRDTVARLPGKQRAALVLRVYEGLTHQEIADTLGTSVGASKASVFHALRNLRRLLGGHGL